MRGINLPDPMQWASSRAGCARQTNVLSVNVTNPEQAAETGPQAWNVSEA
jgi:hypothetical protein